MQAQKETKEQDLVDILLTHIDSRTTLSRALQSEIEHEINRLPSEARAYVTAWLMVALNKHEDAVEWFNEAMNGPDAAVVAGNYVAYLSRSAHNLFHRNEVFRLVEVFCTPRIRKMARNASFCIGNDKLVRQYTLKMIALLDGAEREKIKQEGERMVQAIVQFKEATKLTSSEIQHICDSAEKIANTHGVNCIGVEYFLSGGSDNAMILNAETQDSKTLTDMNLELICMLSDEAFIDRPFTSWFKSSDAGSIAE